MTNRNQTVQAKNAFLWLLYLLATAWLAISLAWSVYARFDYGYGFWYDQLAIGAHIQRYVPKHPDKADFAQLPKTQHVAAFRQISKAVHGRGADLASLRYQVRVLDETLHQGDESTTWQQLERIENSLDEANTELRELISNFRAPVSNRGLVGAIEQTVNHFRSETRIKTYLQKEWTGDTLSKDVEVQILRIIQEALWNIRKHSRAKTVRIMLRHRGNENYHILIEDDGVGFDGKVYGSPGEHVGLSIMRERALRIGGRLRVDSEPGEGTRVVLELDATKPKGGKA